MSTTSSVIYGIVANSLNENDTLEQVRIKKAETRKRAEQLMIDTCPQGGTADELLALCEELTNTFELMKSEGLFGSSEAKTPSGQSVQKNRMNSCSRVFHGAFKRIVGNKKQLKMKGYGPFAVTENKVVVKTTRDKARELYSGCDSQFFVDLDKAYEAYEKRRDNKLAEQREQLKEQMIAQEIQARVEALELANKQLTKAGVPPVAINMEAITTEVHEMVANA